MSTCNSNTDCYAPIDDMHTEQEEFIGELNGLDATSKGPLENEKRMRREIANSNERRRMQNINCGFQSLKTLLPHQDGEKLSKAAILLQTSEYISQLEKEKARLLNQNAHLTRILRERHRDSDTSDASPPPKRKKRDTESSDEGISLGGGDSDELSQDEMRREMAELRSQLDRERRLRALLEQQTRLSVAPQQPCHASQDSAQQLSEYCRVDSCPTAVTHSAPHHHHRSCTECARHPEPPAVPELPNTVDTRQRHDFCPVSSMSRRNLDTIVEAIRHLEGEHALSHAGSSSSSSSSMAAAHRGAASWHHCETLNHQAVPRPEHKSTSKLMHMCPTDLSQQMLRRPAVIVQNT